MSFLFSTRTDHDSQENMGFLTKWLKNFMIPKSETLQSHDSQSFSKVHPRTYAPNELPLVSTRPNIGEDWLTWSNEASSKSLLKVKKCSNHLPDTTNSRLTEAERFAKKLRENRQGKLSLSYSCNNINQKKRPLMLNRPIGAISGGPLGTANFSLRKKPTLSSAVLDTVRPENFEKYKELHTKKIHLLEQIKLWRQEHEISSQLPPVKRIQPLDKDSKLLVNKFWTSRSKNDVLGEVYRVQLSVADIQTLRPRAWLNDNVIDAYLAENSSKTESNTFAFTTHFYTRLEQSGYTAVAKWAKRKKINILELDYLIVPVNRGNMHWCMSIVDNAKKTISFYDSLSSGRGGDDVVRNLVEYLVKEADRLEPGQRDKHIEIFNNYKVIPQADCPQQNNGFDCGVFACQTAVRVSNGSPLDFDQKDMDIIREHMAFNLLKLAGI